jgi:hypothetical protein
MQRSFQPVAVPVAGLPAFRAENRWIAVNDAYQVQLQELFRIRHPGQHPEQHGFGDAFARFAADFLDGRPSDASGNWFYYPWRNTLVHVLPQAEYRLVRSSRNRNLITTAQQAELAGKRVGIAGQSIGASVAAGLALGGYYRVIRLADFDSLSLSSLNRVNDSVTNLGLPKVILTARRICELDPYATVEVVPAGLTEDNLAAFMAGLDVAVCAMDGLPAKLLLRLLARRDRIPVVMALDVENIVIDIERYDLEPDRPPFNGRMSAGQLDRLRRGEITAAEFIPLIAALIGLDELDEPMLSTVLEVGLTVPAHPQLGDSAMIAGGAAARVIRRILLGQPVADGRASLGLNATINPEYHAARSAAHRAALIERFTALTAAGSLPPADGRPGPAGSRGCAAA